jgi:hypothetical protein
MSHSAPAQAFAACFDAQAKVKRGRASQFCALPSQTSIVQKVAAKGGKLSEEELESRLRDLVALLPAIKPRLPSMKPDILLRLAGDVHSVARKLLELKAVFPDADCGRMLAQELSLMSEGAESLRRRAEELRAFLPTVNIDAVVEVRKPTFSCFFADSEQ